MRIVCVMICMSVVMLSQPKKIVMKLSSKEAVRSVVNLGNNSWNYFVKPHQRKSAGIQTTSVRNTLSELEKYVVVSLTNTDNPDSVKRLITTLLKPEFISFSKHFSIEQDNVPDPLLDAQWALRKLEADKAWNYATGKGVTVAFIDTGIEWTHPDLQKQLWVNTKEDLNNNGTFDDWPSSEKQKGVIGDLDGIDNDGNGFTDDVIGYNFVDQFVRNVGDDRARDAFPFDEHGHGTSVAGVIAAQHDNGIGISGLAYNAKLMSIRAFDATGNAEDDDIASAIMYAVDNGARVLNLSFGDVVRSRLVEDALAYAYESGVVVFASSGNSGGRGNHYPSDFDGVISVGSTSESDKKSLFSSFNSRLSIMAPGEGIQTTAIDAGYRKVSGTSFSSPYAASVAALVLELNPNFTPDQVRSVLEVTSDPIDEFTWSEIYGNGRINAFNAVKERAAGSSVIVSPSNDEVVNKKANQTLTITGSVSEPLMKSWQVQFAYSDSLTTWTKIGGGETFVFNSVLATLDLNKVKDTSFILSLLVTMQNGRTFEHRTRCVIPPKKLEITNVRAYNPWHDGKRIFVVTATTNQPTNLYIQYVKDANKGILIERYIGRELNLLGKSHSVVITDFKNLLPTSDTYKGEVIAVNDAGDTARMPVELSIKEEAFQNFGFDKKIYTAPRLYLNNYTQGYSKDSSTFLASDLTNEDRFVRAYKLKDGVITKVDSLNQTWFVRGAGDVDGDGTTDTWAQQGAISKLFSGAGGRVFGKVLFGDSVNQNLWASRVADVNNDGKPELIAYRNNNFEVWSHTSNGFKLIDTIPNTTRPPFNKLNNIFSSPGCAVGDFDKDGKTEIAFSDSDGDLVISEWNNGKFTQEFSFYNNESAGAGTEFTTEADIDGDGTPEILVGSPSSSNYNSNGEYDVPLWVFRVFKSNGANVYKEIWKDYFYGVRYGRPFYNGNGAGNINNQKGDEVALSLFPSLYCFTKQPTDTTLMPLWYKPNVYSNSIMINDFDKNGKKELAFVNGVTIKTEFWELRDVDTSDYPPVLKSVQVTSDSSFIVVTNNNNTSYNSRVYYQFVNDTTVYFNTEKNAHVIRTVPVKNGLYKCWTTRRSIVTQLEGPSSDTFYVQLHPMIEPMFADSVAIGDVSIQIHFSGLVAQKEFDCSEWEVTSNNISYSIQSVVASGNSTVKIFLKKPLQEGSEQIMINVNTPIADLLGGYSKTKKLIAFIRKSSNASNVRFLRLVKHTSTSLTILFSESVDVSALDITKYQLFPYGRVTNIEFLNPEHTQLKLTLDESQPLKPNGSLYTIIGLPSIKAVSGNNMTSGEGNALSFVFSASEGCSSYTFPQPFKYGKDEYLNFGCIPQNATVLLMTLEGATLATITETDNNGGVSWPPRQPSGEQLSSGIYLYKIISSDGTESELYKFIISK